MLTQAISDQLAVSPAIFMQTKYGFWSSKVFLTAINLKLFDFLAEKSRTADEIKMEFNLQNKGLYEFLDALVSLNFLNREDEDKTTRYYNAFETNSVLSNKNICEIGTIFKTANNHLYSFWNHRQLDFQTTLSHRNAFKGEVLPETVTVNELLSNEVIKSVSNAQLNNFIAFAQEFDFSGYYTHCDIGGGGGDLSIQIAAFHPQIQSMTFDLPGMTAIAQQNIDHFCANDRVKIVSGEFFQDSFPKSDLITMGNILHNWNETQKKQIIKRAFDALPSGGALAIIENIIPHENKKSDFELLVSFDMLIDAYGGYDFTISDFTHWAHEAGFKQIQIIHLTESATAIAAYKY